MNTVMLDIIGATVIVGMVIVTIMNININLSTINYQSIMEYHTQTETIQLARIIEFDFYKIGYTIQSAARPAIQIAESSHVKFKTNLGDVPGKIDNVEYNLGGLVTVSKNPRDRMVSRVENTSTVFINYSVTRFYLTYYNSRDSLIPTPITGSMRDSIKSIKVILQLESPDPFDTTRTGGAAYASSMYQKLIYPRNLQ